MARVTLSTDVPITTVSLSNRCVSVELVFPQNTVLRICVTGPLPLASAKVLNLPAHLFGRLTILHFLVGGGTDGLALLA